MHIEPALLRTFVAVNDTKGFTRAAQRLHLTQSAISHQVRRLEAQVGRTLFHRTTRRLLLTADGEDFLRYAERILQAQDALARHFRTSPISGTVRLGVPERCAELPQLLRQFARSCPDVRVEATVGIGVDLQSMVQARELDLAVITAGAGDTEGILLKRSPLCWLAAEEFELPQARSLPLAHPPSPCACRQISIDAMNACGLPWHAAFIAHSLHDLCAVVQAGVAVAALTADNLRPGMKILREADGMPPLPCLDFLLIYADADRTPAASELGRLIEETMRETSGKP